MILHLVKHGIRIGKWVMMGEENQIKDYCEVDKKRI